MFVALRAIFLEKEFLGEGTVASKIELGKVWPVEELAHSEGIIESTMIRSHPKLTLRRFDRVPHQSNRYYDF